MKKYLFNLVFNKIENVEIDGNLIVREYRDRTTREAVIFINMTINGVLYEYQGRGRETITNRTYEEYNLQMIILEALERIKAQAKNDGPEVLGKIENVISIFKDYKGAYYFEINEVI